MTKLVTGVAIMQLVEQNLLSLDDDARDYVPELKEVKILHDMERSDSPAMLSFICNTSNLPC
jgi:methyl acetate hydrolase